MNTESKTRGNQNIATGMFRKDMPTIPHIDYPIPQRENLRRFVEDRSHLYIPNMATDVDMLMPSTDPDSHFPPWEDGYDGFGTHWTYVPEVGAQMVTPGTCALEDIEKWRTDLKWPYLDQYDFTDGMAERIAALDPNKMHHTLLGHGLFERLHSCIGFEQALMSFMVSPEAVHDFFDALTQWKLDYLEKLFAAAPNTIDIVTYADDMGTQRDTFFSPDIFEEFFYDRVKKIFDFIHDHGMYVNYHSCGNNERFAKYYIELGADFWECQRSSNDFARITDNTAGKMPITLGLDSALLSDPNATKEELLAATHEFIDETSRYKNYAAAGYATNQLVADVVLPELVSYSAKKYAAK